MKILSALGFVLALSGVGCAVSTETAPLDGGGEEIEAAPSAVKMAKVDAVPAYFNQDNRYAVTEDASWIYASFNTFTGKVITAHVSLAEGSEQGGVGFKVYRVLGGGKLKLEKTVDGPNGKAVYSFKSKGTGSYVIEMVTSGRLSDVVLRLSCDGDSCSPDPQPGEFCGGIAGVACSEGLYCKYEPEAMCGAADASGTCAVPPNTCTKEYMPVCGCDDTTYGNACMAAANGVSVAREGECGATPGAGEGELCGGIAGIPCEEGLYCAYAESASCGAGDQAGVCAWRPDGCIQIYDPVCGCDGRTYGNGCTAASFGVSVDYAGECVPEVAQVGESCGGFRMGPSPVCAEGLYCNYEIGDTCGWADAPGTCAEKPAACTKEYSPVCGCDGITYGNACTAASSGVAVLHRGECGSEQP